MDLLPFGRMAPLLLLALLLGPAPAQASDARNQARNAAALSDSADEDDDDAVRDAAARPFDANALQDRTVVAPGVTRGAKRLAKAAPGAREPRVEPPLVVEKKPKSKISSGLMLAGATALGGLQGWFTAGMLGAVAGAGLGLAAAWLFQKKDYGASFGVTAGAIIGTAFGGPIGGLIGAVVGGVIGHVLGKLFG